MTDAPPRLHPSITAALERDGVPLARVAELVGMDVRTVEKVRLDTPTEERAVLYRRLDAWIEGRSRAVQGEPGEDGKRWRLDELSQAVSPADVASVADRLLVMAEEAEASARALREQAGKLRVKTRDGASANASDVSDESGLTEHKDRSLLSRMNAQVLQSVARSVKERGKGRMVLFNLKVPPDFKSRVERAARSVGMNSSDFVRALVELHSDAEE